MKFDIEIVCIQEIIVGYISFENFSKKGVLGVKPTSPLYFFLKVVRGTYRLFFDLILCNFSRESYLRYFHFHKGPPRGYMGPIFTDPLKKKIQ